MTEARYLIKDNRYFIDMIERGRELRRQMGIPEPTEEFDPREAGKKWHQMRKRRKWGETSKVSRSAFEVFSGLI